MLTEAQQQLIGDHPAGFVATVTPDGRPAVSPKGTFLVLDALTLAFGNIRSPHTLRNIATNPAVEVNFLDPWRRIGVRVAGTAVVHEKRTERFLALHPKWRAVWGDLADRVRDIVEIRVTEVRDLTTPPYDDGATEEDMIASYRAKYEALYP